MRKNNSQTYTVIFDDGSICTFPTTSVSFGLYMPESASDYSKFQNFLLS